MRGLPELLAPAGTYSALVAAVAAGADAVYTGAGSFNARAGARDLTIDELARGCALAHAHGARVYVALNVYVRDRELASAVELAGRVLEAGADALIVADAGLISAVRRAVPGAEIHLSTQAGVHAPAGAELARREFGVTRVTCGRELSVGEIGAMASTGVEIEAFCHGAICICYAGACAFSALRRGRSANRGDCTQPCRMHYSLEDASGRRVDDREGDMLLCPRDYLSVRHVAELSAAGTGALKIEGRMKNPDYVYNVVSCYREALDALAAGHAVDEAALEERLARSFNRGFSVEYLEGRSGAELMSWERSCNQGLFAGRVVERRYEEVLVEFEHPVYEGDTLEIRFIPGEDAPADVPKRWPMVPCPVNAAAGERVAVRCKRKVDAGSEVWVVRSVRALEDARRAIARLDEDAAAGSLSGRDASGRAPHVRDDGGAPVLLAPAPAVRTRAERIVVAASADEARAALGDESCATVAVRAESLLEEGAGDWGELLPRMAVILEAVSHASDERRHRELCRMAGSVVCRNLTQVAYAIEEGCRFDVAAPITVSNAESALVMAGLGASRCWLPDELPLDEVLAIGESVAGRVPLAVRTAGRAGLMTCEHCLLTSEGPCSGACAACPRRLSGRWLVERDGSRLPVHVDALGRTHLMDADPLARGDWEGRLGGMGIACVHDV